VKFNLKKLLGAAALAIGTHASAALLTVLPTDPNWGNPAGENGGGGSSAITATMPGGAGGTGSLELFGDRTRFFGLGNPYSAASNLGKLSEVLAFAFDWMIALDSASNLHADYTPALRLHIWDGAQRSELIWEGAYNGTYGNTTKGVWYSTGSNDVFWRWVTGVGQTNQPVGGAIALQTIGQWATGQSNNGTDWYSDDAYVSAISIGAGSSVGGTYHAFADHVVFNNVGGGDRTFDPESGSYPVAGSSGGGCGVPMTGAMRSLM